MRTVENQLLIKSFGYGVFLAETVPPENIKHAPTPGNGDPSVSSKILADRVRKSGLSDIRDIIPDPEDSNRVYFALLEGQPPCQFERGQMSDDDYRRLRQAVDASTSGIFMDRIRMLDSPT